jgi:hypothetical protein
MLALIDADVTLKGIILFIKMTDDWSKRTNRLASRTLFALSFGIDMFEINIYEVTQSTPPTLMRNTTTVGNYTLEPNATEVEITLPDKNPMLYVIFLEVKDKANNVREARRFVMDSDRKLETVPYNAVFMLFFSRVYLYPVTPFTFSVPFTDRGPSKE